MIAAAPEETIEPRWPVMIIEHSSGCAGHGATDLKTKPQAVALLSPVVLCAYVDHRHAQFDWCPPQCHSYEILALSWLPIIRFVGSNSPSDWYSWMEQELE